MVQGTSEPHAVFWKQAEHAGAAEVCSQPRRHSEMLMPGQQLTSALHAELQSTPLLVPPVPPPPPLPPAPTVVPQVPELQLACQLHVPLESVQLPLELLPLTLPEHEPLASPNEIPVSVTLPE